MNSMQKSAQDRNLKATDYNMVKANKAVVAPVRKPKRAKAFTRPELVEIVRFLDEKKYGVGKRGEIQQRKSELMHELSILLLNKFGTKHCLRQVQKRFSDLKVRQKKTLAAIRNQIKREKEQQHIEKDPDAEGTTEATQQMAHLCIKDQNNEENQPEYFTLHLESIPDTQNNVVENVSLFETVDEGAPFQHSSTDCVNIHNLEQRMIKHLADLEKRLSDKIDNLKFPNQDSA